MATAGAVTGAALVGGNALFSYNRANFMFDAGQKWARYTAGYAYAQDQVGMYRADVDQITGITIAKMDNIHAVSGLMVVIIIQLIMAGRLGVHGPAPPGWLMGLYWPNVGLCMMWLALAAWLAMHAGARAQAAAAYMKTHSVRLPIPTPKQLDKARVFGNHWERQRVLDVFRVPFVTPAPVDDPADLRDETKAKGAKGNKKTRKTAGPPTDFRTPGWLNEEIRDLHGGIGGAPVTSETTPVHFEELRGAQHEWWAHESYARVSIFFAWTHWLAGASLYIMCHCFIELRAMWPAWSCTFCFVACHLCMNLLDINGSVANRSVYFNIPMEYLVPFTPLIAVSCMQIDYSVLEEWRSTWAVFIWICSFVSYTVHFLYALRMYDLAMPSQDKEHYDKEAGKAWWPSDWKLPMAFQHCLYLVAPPKHLEPGETDLWQEMKAGRGTGASMNRPPVKARLVSAQTNAWFIMRGGLLSTIFIWGFIIIGRIYAMALIRSNNGDMRYQLKQEGRTMRWPSHMQPWMTPWTRLGSRNEYCHTGGCDRRLGEFQWKSRHAMADVAERLVPNLQTISDVLTYETDSHAPAKATTPLHRVAVEWPGQLRPELLACSSTGSAIAMSRAEHKGAFLPSLPFVGVEKMVQPELQHFTLEGTKSFGEVMGSHLGEDGLMLIMKNGHIAECTGLPVKSNWPCRQINARLPMGGSSIRKAVVARIPTNKNVLRAAVVYNDDNSSVTLFEVDVERGTWIPSGDARLPPFTEQASSFSMSSGAEELVLSTEGGGVLKWAIAAAEPVMMAPPPQMDAGRVWQSACHLGDNRVARLGWQQNQDNVWMPEIFTSTSM